MRRPQFTIRALLVLMLVVAAFFSGVRLERERRRRADEAAVVAVKAAKKSRRNPKRVMEPPGKDATAEDLKAWGRYLQSRTYAGPRHFYFLDGNTDPVPPGAATAGDPARSADSPH
ncbi:MAG TPA: hypothetical protein VHC22_27895 [Pirellulales bacterium]|nr:hypothetical protein [Pirellulales bacterium]